MTVPIPTSSVQAYSSQLSGYPTFLPWDQIQGLFGVEPGRVFLEDFDLGIVETMGAYIDPNAPVDEQSFVLRVNGLKDEGQRVDSFGKSVVPVTFAHPESYMNIWTLPGIFVRRESIEPDLQRYSQELEGFRIPAPQAKFTTIDGMTGPDTVLSRPRPEAYNLYYSIDMLARYQTDANALLRVMLNRYKQHKAILVRDDKGDLNEYTAFLESVDQISEILGVTLKHHGFSLNLKVIGELDVDDSTLDITRGPNDIRKTAQEIQLEVVPKDPTVPNPIEMTEDGLPLKTDPALSLGRICTLACLRHQYWQTGLF